MKSCWLATAGALDISIHDAAGGWSLASQVYEAVKVLDAAVDWGDGSLLAKWQTGFLSGESVSETSVPDARLICGTLNADPDWQGCRGAAGQPMLSPVLHSQSLGLVLDALIANGWFTSSLAYQDNMSTLEHETITRIAGGKPLVDKSATWYSIYKVGSNSKILAAGLTNSLKTFDNDLHTFSDARTHEILRGLLTSQDVTWSNNRVFDAKGPEEIPAGEYRIVHSSLISVEDLKLIPHFISNNAFNGYRYAGSELNKGGSDLAGLWSASLVLKNSEYQTADVVVEPVDMKLKIANLDEDEDVDEDSGSDNESKYSDLGAMSIAFIRQQLEAYRDQKASLCKDILGEAFADQSYKVTCARHLVGDMMTHMPRILTTNETSYKIKTALKKLHRTVGSRINGFFLDGAKNAFFPSKNQATDVFLNDFLVNKMLPIALRDDYVRRSFAEYPRDQNTIADNLHRVKIDNRDRFLQLFDSLRSVTNSYMLDHNHINYRTLTDPSLATIPRWQYFDGLGELNLTDAPWLKGTLPKQSKSKDKVVFVTARQFVRDLGYMGIVPPLEWGFLEPAYHYGDVIMTHVGANDVGLLKTLMTNLMGPGLHWKVKFDDDRMNEAAAQLDTTNALLDLIASKKPALAPNDSLLRLWVNGIELKLPTRRSTYSPEQVLNLVQVILKSDLSRFHEAIMTGSFESVKSLAHIESVRDIEKLLSAGEYTTTKPCLGAFYMESVGRQSHSEVNPLDLVALIAADSTGALSDSSSAAYRAIESLISYYVASNSAHVFDPTLRSPHFLTKSALVGRLDLDTEPELTPWVAWINLNYERFKKLPRFDDLTLQFPSDANVTRYDVVSPMPLIVRLSVTNDKGQLCYPANPGDLSIEDPSDLTCFGGHHEGRYRLKGAGYVKMHGLTYKLREADDWLQEIAKGLNELVGLQTSIYAGVFDSADGRDADKHAAHIKYSPMALHYTPSLLVEKNTLLPAFSHAGHTLLNDAVLNGEALGEEAVFERGLFAKPPLRLLRLSAEADVPVSHSSVRFLVDPLSVTGQSMMALADYTNRFLKQDVQILFTPYYSYKSPPINSWYRERSQAPLLVKLQTKEANLDTRVEFMETLTEGVTTLRIDAATSLVVRTDEAETDLDNIVLKDAPNQRIQYRLAGLRLEGSLAANEDGRSRAPLGNALIGLYDWANGTLLDVASSSEYPNYYQLIAPNRFGKYEIRLMANEVTRVVKDKANKRLVRVRHRVEAEKPLTVVLDGWNQHQWIQDDDALVFPLRIQHTEHEVVRKTSKGPLGHMMNWLKKPNAADDGRVHIFSLASGHMYERLLRIMMLSVRKTTKRPLTFWILENFLSANFKEKASVMEREYPDLQIKYVSYEWPVWLRPQTDKQRQIWANKVLFLDFLFRNRNAAEGEPGWMPSQIIYIDADQVVRGDVGELWDLEMGEDYILGLTPFCGETPHEHQRTPPPADLKVEFDRMPRRLVDARNETLKYRFWNNGYWANYLDSSKVYHISALFKVDLRQFVERNSGGVIRDVYNQLTKPNANDLSSNLQNLDQDLLNYVQYTVPMFSLPQEWLWCETWCSDAIKARAKTIDLCNNPQTRQHKLAQARRIVPEWTAYDRELHGPRTTPPSDEL